jgi:hypothetical protein
MLDDPVVIHFTDGRTLPGHADEPVPGETELLVRDAATDEHVTVHLRQVKVVCFVKSHSTTGVVRNREAPPLVRPTGAARRVELVFRDGEKMSGTVTEQDRPERAFFLTPLNPNSNNRKVYVNPAQVVSFRFVT